MTLKFNHRKTDSQNISRVYMGVFINSLFFRNRMLLRGVGRLVSSSYNIFELVPACLYLV